MKSRPLTALAIVLAVGLGAALPGMVSAIRADDAPKKGAGKEPGGSAATADWYKDPDCRLVFFATLEGLYADGIPTEVVDLVLGKRSKLGNKVKHNFIFRCKLCHAVYEAFVLYRNRQTFAGSKVDTFKAGNVSDATLTALRSDEARTRVYAMGSLVQPWIKRRLLASKLSDSEKRDLARRLTKLAQDGINLTDKHRNNDPDYGEDWRFYGSCQACEAVKTVSKTLEKAVRK